MNEKQWLEVITRLYPKLHTTDRVIHHSESSDKKVEKILKWMNKIEEVHNKVAEKNNKHLDSLYKEMYYNLYVIKEEDIPESYYQNQVRLARERGYGNIELTDEMRHSMALEIIKDQEESLGKWIDYFLYDEESKCYSMLEKFWVFQGLQKLGKFNKEKGKFDKRDDTTVYPFPEVEREAIFNTLNLMEQYLKDKTTIDEIKDALTSYNFKTLYEFSLNQILKKGERQNTSNEGIWIKYDQGSDYRKLRDSLQGYYTGWCTAAGEEFARTQLENGDFYVYYTKNIDGKYEIPRIAIRMEGQDEIGEIRGIEEDQELEAEMLPILRKKLKEFPKASEYYKKEIDMSLLTKIDNKVNNNIELSLSELRFLYELDNEIEGFGFRRDPRIDEIKSNRNPYKDFSLLFNCMEDDIGVEVNEDDYSKCKIWVGNLELDNLESAEGLVLPEVVYGNLELDNLESAEGLVLPEMVSGYLDLFGLESAEGLVFPKVIGGDLNLYSLQSAEGLVLPEVVRGDLKLSNLENIEGLVLPEIIDGNVYFNYLIDEEMINLLKNQRHIRSGR